MADPPPARKGRGAHISSACLDLYHDESAKAWLYGKMLVALLVEKVVRHALTISPWGYEVETGPDSQPVA